MTIQYAQKQSILGSKNGLKRTWIVHIAQMSTDRIRILCEILEVNVDENTLNPCPFCGSEKLKIETKSGRIHYYEKNGMKSWQNVVFSVRCNSCHARGGTFSIDLPISGLLGDLKNKKKEATDKAIERWNRRK